MKTKRITVVGLKKEECKPDRAWFTIDSGRNEFSLSYGQKVLTMKNLATGETLLNAMVHQADRDWAPTFNNLLKELDSHGIILDLKFFGDGWTREAEPEFAKDTDIPTPIVKGASTSIPFTPSDLALLSTTNDDLVERTAELEFINRELASAGLEDIKSRLVMVNYADIGGTKNFNLLVDKADVLSSAKVVTELDIAHNLSIFESYGLKYTTSEEAESAF